MKKFLILLLTTLIINGCDDGEIEVVTFDFTGVAAKSCNLQTFFVYAFKDNRTFILQIDDINFKNVVTPSGSPIIVPIAGNTKVTYREYNANISDQTLCSSPPDAGLIRTKEWIATGGIVEITTTAVLDENTSLNSSSIASYNHTIVFKNVAFNTEEGEQKNDIIQFGIYNKINPNKLTIEPSLNPIACGTNPNVLYKFSGDQTLTLNLDPTLFDTAVLNTAKVKNIDNATNKLIYRKLSTGNTVLTNAYFCSSTVPFQNVELWTSQIATGTIQVITENNMPNGYKHTIKLLNVVMEKGDLRFRLGNEYLFGVYTQL